MGVLSCSREGCQNIMCDTYVPTIGYICTDCQEEFKGYMQSNSDNLGMISNLEDFMSTYKDEYKNDISNEIDDFFREHTTIY